MAITMLILGMLSLVVFNSIIYVISVTVLTSVIMIFIIYWKKMMGGDSHGH